MPEPDDPGVRPRTRAELRALGWTDSAINELLRGGSWRSMHRGVLAPRSLSEGFVTRVRGAALAVGTDAVGLPRDVVVGRETAARWWGLEGLDLARADEGAPVQIWVPPGTNAESRPGIDVRTTTIHDAERVASRGIQITSPARSVIDLARERGFATGLTLADAMLRQRLGSLADLEDVVSRMGRARGVVVAREVARFARQGTRSCAESRLRAPILRSGLPCPAVGFALFDAEGRMLAEADLAYVDLLIWIEYDGFDVHTRRRAFGADRVRHRWLERRGWFVLRTSAVDLGRPHLFLADLEAAIADARRRIAALPATRSPEVAAARRALGLDAA